MTTGKAKQEEEKSSAKEDKAVTFQCKFCGRSLPLDEMRLITRFFPPLISCRDCEKRIQ